METRLATRDEVALFGNWAEAEGWLPGRGDAEAFFDADPQGFHVGIESGRVVATVSVVRYGAAHAFLGFYIVVPDRRGQGLGHRIWAAGMESVPGRVVGLDGVAAQVPTYESAGFAFSHWTHRFSGQCAEVLAGSGADTAIDVRSVDADDPGFAAVAAFDRLHVPEARPAFLRSWLASRSLRKSFVAVADGAVAGYATVRPAVGNSARIGPLFAVSERVARVLLAACARSASAWGERICIDVPERNADATRLATSLGMAPDFACARMYFGPAPDLPYARIYGNTSFELG